MCIRDDAGDSVLARIGWFFPLCDVMTVEAIGLHTALQWGSNLLFDNVDFVLNS